MQAKNNISGQAKVVVLDKVFPNPWNYNEQDPAVFEKEKRSILKHGFVEPIVVRKHPEKDGYEIVDGFHRWRACKELEMNEISVIDMGEMAQTDAEAQTITYNETHGKPNEVRKAAIYADLAGKIGLKELMEVVPDEKKEIERLLKMANFSWDDMKDKGDEPEMPHETDVQLRTYNVVLDPEKLSKLRAIMDGVMKENDASEGRALELLCGDFLAN